jgi:hypothetical protein
LNDDPEDAAALKDLIPQSIWKRCFADLVDCEDLYLKTCWEKLDELRCKVAHNALMTAKYLEDTQKLISEVKPPDGGQQQIAEG